ncbi:MAG TPA: radical SAM protein [Betaproteobacteria bacterium]|nr:radical SAM protein [Betaproteobacteria bacterium]
MSDKDDWLRQLRHVESLRDLALDPSLIDGLASLDNVPGRPLHFFTPSFKHYASDEILPCSTGSWPAVSITGADCELQCDHCRARILRPMLAARTPQALWRIAERLIAQGGRGMLLTGGSDRRNTVKYDAYYSTIQRIKTAYPTFEIAAHTALVDESSAKSLAQCGVDVAMLDLIGAQETITQVYHLRRGVDDFERSLALLTATRMRVVPHIVAGLHYGKLVGEHHALEMVRRHPPAALVLVVVMPYYAPRRRPFAIPDSAAIGRLFLDARRLLPALSLRLGCARPAGRTKAAIDSYAVMAGFDGVAHPADGVVELAVRLGRQVSLAGNCCATVGAPPSTTSAAGFAPPLRRLIASRRCSAADGVSLPRDAF